MPLGAFKAALMGTAGVSTADVVLLYDTDHSDVASVSITSGITSTYGEYIFRLYSVNPETDITDILFQCSIDGGSNYNVAVTSTFFDAEHDEADAGYAVSYRAANDYAQSTSFIIFADDLGSGADECAVAELHLFNPSSTTYVKHFFMRSLSYHRSNQCFESHLGGYFNTTSAVNAIQFKPSQDNFDGTIKMWGVK